MQLIPRIAGYQLIIAMVALVVMGCVTTVDVLLKYLVSRPIVGAYDIVETLLPVVIFHGLPAAILRRQNIIIDVVDHFVSLRCTGVLNRLADIVTVALLLVITWAMTGPAFQALEYGDRKVELGLPIFLVWIAVLVGMFGAMAVSIDVLGRPSTKLEKAD